MRKHYDRSPTTGCKALFIYKPDQAPSAETRYFIWHKPPRRLSLTPHTVNVEDKQAYLNTNWAKGRSLHRNDWKPEQRPINVVKLVEQPLARSSHTILNGYLKQNGLRKGGVTWPNQDLAPTDQTVVSCLPLGTHHHPI